MTQWWLPPYLARMNTEKEDPRDIQAKMFAKAEEKGWCIPGGFADKDLLWETYRPTYQTPKEKAEGGDQNRQSQL